MSPIDIQYEATSQDPVGNSSHPRILMLLYKKKVQKFQVYMKLSQSLLQWGFRHSKTDTSIFVYSFPFIQGPSRLTRSQLSLHLPSPSAMAKPRSGSMARSVSSAGAASTGLVTTREAVVGEVIAEETKAAEDRLREESGDAKKNRSWLTSWMFSRSREK